MGGVVGGVGGGGGPTDYFVTPNLSWGWVGLWQYNSYQNNLLGLMGSTMFNVRQMYQVLHCDQGPPAYVIF